MQVLGAAIAHHPGVVFPLLGLFPLGMATELPGTGVALAQGSGSSAATSTGCGSIAGCPADGVHDLAERLEAVPAHERVAMRQSGHHATRLDGEHGSRPYVD